MENLRNKRMVDLVALEKKFKKLAAQPSVAVKHTKVELMLNRPIYVRFSILDLSKTLMYDFQYNYINQKIDTDSLTHQI